VNNPITITVEHEVPLNQGGLREISVTHLDNGGIVLAVEDSFAVAIAEIPASQVDEFLVAVNKRKGNA
jgi:hypothetical protein